MSSIGVTLPSRSWIQRSWRDDRARVLLFAVIVLAITIRFLSMAWHALGSDEVASLYFAQYGAPVPDYSPLFTFILHFWQNAGLAENAWLISLFPLLLSVSGLVSLFAYGKEAANSLVGLVCALLFSIAPLFVAQGTYVVASAAAIAFCVWPAFFMHRAWRTSHAEHWILYAVSAAAAIFASPVTLTILLALNIWFIFIVRSARAFFAWAVSNAFIALVCGIHVRRLVFETDWNTFKPARERTIELLMLAGRHAVMGFDFDPMASWAGCVLFLLLVILGCILQLKRNWQSGLLLVMLVLLPAGILIGAAIRGLPVTMISLTPAFLTGTAAASVALAAISMTWLRTSVIFGCVVVLASASVMDLGNQAARTDLTGISPRIAWAQTAKDLVRNVREGDVVTVTDASAFLPLHYYSSGSLPLKWLAPDATQFQVQSNGRAAQCLAILGQTAPQEIEPGLRDAQRVWVVCPRPADDAEVSATRRNIAWCDAHASQTNLLTYAGVDVALYERAIAGRWTRMVSRVADDDEFAQVVYDIGTKSRMRIRRPIVYGDPDREGRFSLSLEAAQEEARHINMCLGTAARRQGVVFTNDTAVPATITISFAATSQLAELSGFVERRAESSVWRFGDLNSSLLPMSYPPASVIVAKTEPQLSISGTFLGATDLDRGKYNLFLFQRVTPPAITEPRVQLQLSVGGQSMYTGLAEADGAAPEWRWTSCGWFELAGDDDRVNIAVDAIQPVHKSDASAEAGYIAFVPAAEGVSAGQQMSMVFQTVSVEVAPGTSERWMCQLGNDTTRFDAWVVVDGPGGRRQYHVFERWPRS
jgi:hypothetical protein